VAAPGGLVAPFDNRKGATKGETTGLCAGSTTGAAGDVVAVAACSAYEDKASG
jgi:hypothetical protein